jgi:hypothetical protein
VPEKEMARVRVLFSLRQLPDREWPSLVEARFSLAAGRILTTKRNLKMRRMMNEDAEDELASSGMIARIFCCIFRVSPS